MCHAYIDTFFFKSEVIAYPNLSLNRTLTTRILTLIEFTVVLFICKNRVSRVFVLLFRWYFFRFVWLWFLDFVLVFVLFCFPESNHGTGSHNLMSAMSEERAVASILTMHAHGKAVSISSNQCEPHRMGDLFYVLRSKFDGALHYTTLYNEECGKYDRLKCVFRSLTTYECRNVLFSSNVKF